MWKLFPTQNPETPTRTVRGKAIVITPDDSVLHTLNSTGTFIWELADGSRTLEGIALACMKAFDVTEAVAREEASAFVAKASQRGLLELREQPLDAGKEPAG